MAVNADLKKHIDTTIKQGMSSAAFEQALSPLVQGLFLLARKSPDEIVNTSAYLACQISTQLIRSDNYNDQALYAISVANVLQTQYNEPATSALLGRLSRRQIIEVVRNIYNFHLALTANGYDGPRLTAAMPNRDDPLRLLRAIVSSALGHWPSVLRINTDDPLDPQNRIVGADGADHIEIGPRPAEGRPAETTMTTWSLQGSRDSAENNWRNYILWLVRASTASGFGVVAVQKAGAVPSSARLLQKLAVSDQFGVSRDVDQYRWNAGTSTSPEWYQIYHFEVQSLQVDLALVVPEANRLAVAELTIVADGVPGDQGTGSSPALGAVFRQPGASEALTAYTFHARSENGLKSAPRLLREIAWHTTTSNFALIGDFDLDPVADGDWVSPARLATIYEANGNTFPSVNSTAMLDYAVAEGMSLGAAQARGQVQNTMGSDHRAVVFYLRFPFG